MTSLKKEVAFFKSKVENEEEKHKSAAKAWQQTEAQIRAQLAQVTEKEAQARKNLEDLTNSSEGLKEQLKMIQVTTILPFEITTLHAVLSPIEKSPIR